MYGVNIGVQGLVRCRKLSVRGLNLILILERRAFLPYDVYFIILT